MHERYIHQAIVFAGIWALLSRKYLFYVLLSLAYVLDLNQVLGFWGFQKRMPSINSQWNIAWVFALALIVALINIAQSVAAAIVHNKRAGKTIDNLHVDILESSSVH